MKKMKQLLSVLLLAAMLISVLVLSVSAETSDVLISTAENGCVASADNYNHEAQKPEKLIDGNMNSCWMARSENASEAGKPGGQYTQQPSAYLTWDKPQTVSYVEIYDGDESYAPEGVTDTWVSNMEVTFYNSKDELIKTISANNTSMQKCVVSLETPLSDVEKLQIKILKVSGFYPSSGFTEIKAYGSAQETEVPEGPDPDESLIDPANFRIVSNRGNDTVTNLINSSGMSDADGELTLKATHDAEWTNMWLTDFDAENANVAPWVMVDLGQAYALRDMYVWNWNHSVTTRGLKNVKIEYATSITGDFYDYAYAENDWTALDVPEGMTFENANTDYPFQFAKSEYASALKATNLNDGNHTPVSFGENVVRYVRITASPEQYNGNWGGAPVWSQNDFGMAELRFTADLEKSVQAPVLDLVGGEYDSVQTVTMTSETEGASIYYTTDGTEPTATSTLYTTPVTVDRSMTVKAIAVKADCMDSRVVTAEYVLTVKAPVIAPEAGQITADQKITMTCETEGASIYYTTDGSTPTVNSTQYARPFAIGKTATVKAIAVKGGWENSQVVVREYVISIDDYLNGNVYVATTGNDETGDGSQGNPFATIERARDYVRSVNGNMTKDITVHILPGEYFVREPIVFNELDSGSSNHKIIYKAENGVDTVELIGGYRVESDWTVLTGEESGADGLLPEAAVGKVYKTNVGTDHAFNTLYVNDRRATMARFPNLDHESKFVSAKAPYLRSAGGGLHELVFKANDLAPVIDALRMAYEEGYEEDLQVYMWDGGYWDWMTDTIPVASIHGNQLNFKRDPARPEMYVPHFETQSNARYFIQGSLTLLDEPGEYYYNKTTGDLYYYPVSGSMDGVDVIVPTMEKILDVKGASREQAVRNLTFDSLEVKDTDTPEYYTYAWNQADSKGALGFAPPEAMQPGVTQPSYCEQTERAEFQVGTITLINTENITITNSHIKNTGMFGVELYLANKNAKISNCLIEHTGHGGVHMDGGYPGVGGDENGDGYSRNNVVTNCIIHDIGETVGQATGVTIINSGYNTVSHCEIYNSPRRGVFLSGAVSRGSVDNSKYDRMKHLYTHNNTVEYVYIHDCQQDGGDDGALFVQNLFTKDAYKPNWFRQITIDFVASNPSMTDIAPNCINLDGHISGCVLENVKTVNPQHFNMEVNSLVQGAYMSVVDFENTNGYFGPVYDGFSTFDDSKMDYAKIGVTLPGFPEAYRQPQKPETEREEVLFEDAFEETALNENWTVEGNAKTTNMWMSEGVMRGKSSLELWNTDRVSRCFTDSLNKIVTVKMFDRQCNNLPAYASGVTYSPNNTTFVTVGNETTTLGLGVQRGNLGTYMVDVNGERTSTGIQRTAGWHELTFDVTDGVNAVLSFDGVEVGRYPMTSFNQVSLGTEDGVGEAHFDEFCIYGNANIKSDAKDILSFNIPNQVGETVIDSENNTITVTMPADTDVTSLVPEITVSADAAVSPASGIAQDFTNAVTYTVTAENGTTKIYTVKVNLKMTDINPPEENVDKPGWIIPGRPSKPSKPSFDDVPFHDVVKSDWFYDEVSYVYHNGLMNGTRPGEFEPETAITRSMIVTILYRLEGEPMNNYVGLFADVENYKWYTDAVEWAAKNDIVTGYTTGNFGPMDPVTREQLAAILYRYADFCGYDVDGSANLKSFNDDETISNYAVDAMEWAVANNLLNGSHNNLAPKANATRAQAAAILMRFCEEAAK